MMQHSMWCFSQWYVSNISVWTCAISPHRLFFMSHLTWIQFSHLRTAILRTWIMCPFEWRNPRPCGCNGLWGEHVQHAAGILGEDTRLTCSFITSTVRAICSCLFLNPLTDAKLSISLCCFISRCRGCRGLWDACTCLLSWIPPMMLMMSTKEWNESKNKTVLSFFLHFYTMFSYISFILLSYNNPLHDNTHSSYGRPSSEWCTSLSNMVMVEDIRLRWYRSTSPCGEQHHSLTT